MTLLYEGKAKKIFAIPGETNQVRLEYKDSLTAFNALKKGSFEKKGEINRDMASLIFQHLKTDGIESHWVRDEGTAAMVVKKLSIIPLEVVVRNILAGSTAKKFGIEEGRKLPKPLVEFYYKDDALQDPFISDDQIVTLGFAEEKDLPVLKKKALAINQSLMELFAKMKIDLVDFKIEFGKTAGGEILLGDEITPDCCRLWDQETKEKMDKDRFRRDLGSVGESYLEVLNRLKKVVKREGSN